MNTRQWTGIAAAAALLIGQFAGPAPSQAQEPPAATLSEEYAKQAEIYQRPRPSRGYVVDRTLDGYCYMLPDEFDDALERLGEQDRWLDVGAGEGQAVLDYYTPAYDKERPVARKRRGKKAKSVAISIEDRRTPEWQKSAAARAGRAQYRHGKPLREYTEAELGRFQLITDVMGGFTYATDLSRYMQTVMRLLEVDGSFFTLLQDVEIEEGTNKPWYDDYPYFSTEIESATGAKVPMCSWLKSITCAEVRCEARPDRRPQQEVYHVRKVCDQVSVPALVPVEFQAGTPPQRGYRLGSRKSEVESRK
jgi:hypothetical protein